MNRQMKFNIYRLYVIKTAKWFSLITPFIVIFLTDTGLSMSQIFLLKSVYSIGMLSIEIPSGYFGDVWGRKKTLIIGTLLTTVGYGIYSGSFVFWQFMVAELILGIGQSFISGTDSAMLYDSLKSTNDEKNYLKYEGRVTSVGNFSEAIAGVLGGLLAGISLRFPFICQTALSALAIPAAFTLVEPKLNLEKRVAGLKDILKVIKFAIVDYKQLRYFILFSSLIGTATLTYAWLLQPFLIEAKLPLVLFGVVWTALNLTVGTLSILAHRIEKRYTRQQITGAIFILIALGFLLSSIRISLWALPIVFGFYLVRGVATPVLKDYINVLIDSDVRATVLSLRNMFIRIIFAVIGPVLGWIIDRYSLKTSLVVGGLFFLLSGTILYYFTYFHKSSTKPS